MQINGLKILHNEFVEKRLFSRYINLDSILPLLKEWSEKIRLEVVGESVKSESIFALTLGTGPIKILMWSQMHGNESTTTKALFDLIHFLSGNSLITQAILNTCTIKVIPILNPDGARAYTRLNANSVDLNRDAQNLSQPESRALRTLFDSFHPNYCFNLHGQRTIFSAGLVNNPATVSFLAPAQDFESAITMNRKRAMEIISVMNKNLQQNIPNQVGIYDDTFNINCVGDTFQSLNVPTILIEAGHYSKDYNREITRRFIFESFVVALNFIASSKVKGIEFQDYFEIPKNEKLFYDVIIRNSTKRDIALQYEEFLSDGKIRFIPKVAAISDLKDFYGHLEINAKGYIVMPNEDKVLKVGNEIDFVEINNEKFSFIL